MRKPTPVRVASWAGSSLVAVAAVLLTSASAADAVPFGCYSGNQYTCATVTAISPGSALRMHRQPNYTSGVVRAARHTTTVTG